MALLTRHGAMRDAQTARNVTFRAPRKGLAHPVKGTSRPSRMARQERVSRTQEGPRARKNVTHIVTILCVQGSPRGPLSLPIYPNKHPFFLSKFPIL